MAGQGGCSFACRIAMFGLFSAVLMHMSLAQDVVVSPKGHVMAKGGSTHPVGTSQDVSHSLTGQHIQPFKQSTVGSTPQGWMQLGTPPKWLKVIFDTGSDKLVAKTWSTISAELASIDQGLEGLVMPSAALYDHNASTSYVHKMMKNPITGQEGIQMSQIAYGSGAAITEEGIETVSVGARMLKNFSISEISQDSLQLLHTSKGIAGILGLQHMKNKSMGSSIFSKMREANLLSSFGYCRGSNNTGTFIWGDDSKEGLEVPVLGQMHWAVTLQNVKVQKDHASDSLAEKGKRRPQRPHVVVRTRQTRQQHGHAHIKKHEARGWQHAWPFGDPNDIAGAPQDIGGDGFGGPDAGGSGMGGDGSGMGGDFPDGSAGEGGDPNAGGDPFDMGGDGDAAGGDGDPFDMGGDGQGGGMASDQFDQGMPQDMMQDASKHMCNAWNCTAILDTGSNIIAGPTKAIQAIVEQINVKNDCSNFDQLPPMTFKLGGHDVKIHASSYVMKVELPPGMAGVMGGDGAGGDPFGDDGSGDGDAGGQAFGDADQGDGDGSAEASGSDGDAGNGDMGDPSGCGGGGCGGMGGGCGGGGCGDAGGAGGPLDTLANERVGVAMPHGVKIGIPGNHGKHGISIEINRRDPKKHGTEGHVRDRLRGESASLAQNVAKKHESSTTARWRALLLHLKTHRGIDLITALRELFQHENGKDAQYLCMPALVPIDKHTAFGPLWIVGTPFLDEYYGRYSFDKDSESPKFHFKPLQDSKTCQNLHSDTSSPSTNSTNQLHSMYEQAVGSPSAEPAAPRHRLVRSEQTTFSKSEQPSRSEQARKTKKGPTIRTLDEIAYPHWAKSLLKI